MPADHDHRQQVAGERDRDRIGRGHAVLVQQEDAGQARDGGRQHEGRSFVPVGRIAEKARALLVLADATSTEPTVELWKRRSRIRIANAIAATNQ